MAKSGGTAPSGLAKLVLGANPTDAEASWRRKRKLGWTFLAFNVLLVGFGVLQGWSLESRNADRVHATATITNLVGKGAGSVTWTEDGVVHEGSLTSISKDQQVGDTIDIVHPKSDPTDIGRAGLAGWQLSLMYLVMALFVVPIWLLLFRPPGIALRLASGDGPDTPVTIARGMLGKISGAGVWTNAARAMVEPPDAVVPLGIGSVLPPGPQPALLRGDLRARHVVVLRYDGNWLKTVGRVLRPKTPTSWTATVPTGGTIVTPGISPPREPVPRLRGQRVVLRAPEAGDAGADQLTQQPNRLDWVITYQAEPIGTAHLDVDNDASSAEFAIGLSDPDAFGRGFGTDATATILRHAFDTLHLHRVELHVPDDDERATRYCERNGFTEEGRLRQAIQRDGVWHDAIVMSIIADEWQKRGGHR